MSRPILIQEGKLKRNKKKLTKRKQSFMKYLYGQTEDMTFSGFANIFNTNLHFLERLYWLLCYVLCFVLIKVFIAHLLNGYLESPVVVTVESDYYNWNISLPAFTLCPQDEKINWISFDSIVREYQEKTGLNLSSSILLISQITLENIDLMKLETVKHIPIPAKEYAPIVEKTFKSIENISMATNINVPIRIEKAMTEMGMCHVVNSNVAAFDRPSNWGNKTMMFEKTNIETAAHDGDVFAQISYYHNGVYKVYLHSPNELAYATSVMYLKRTVGFFSIGLNIWSTRITDLLASMPLFIRKCRLINEPISKRYPIYSYNHCMLECRIQKIIKLCNCVPHFYKPLDNEKVCSLQELLCVAKNKKHFMTLRNKRSLDKTDNFNRKINECECLHVCNDDSYIKDFEDVPLAQTNDKLRIGISKFPKKRVVKDLLFTVYDIILRCGGAANLCIGCSFISIMEFTILLLKIVCKYFVRYYQYLV